MVSVHVIGCGDAFCNGARFNTCFLLRTDGAAVLLDCGATSLMALRQAGVDPLSIDTVCITHPHGDHFGGLPFLLLDGRFAGRTRPLTIVGPPRIEARLAEAMEALFPGSKAGKLPYPVTVRELNPREPVDVGDLRVTGYPVQHRCGSPPMALRLAWRGRTVAYSGDTAWTEALCEAAADADLFLCECYQYDRPVPFHLDYHTLLAHRHELGAKRTVLTHLGPEMLAQLPHIDWETAHDGMLIEL